MSTASVFALARQPAEKVIDTLRRGITTQSFADVAKAMNLPTGLLAQKLGISQRTLNRKKSEKALLSLEDSQKIMRIARVRNIASEVFSDNGTISDWLSKPAPALNGSTPLDLMDTDVGAREVELLLQGIAYGNVI